MLAALEEELGPLRERVVGRRRTRGPELLELDLGPGGPALACIAGVGKVRAARAATALVQAGPLRALLVVGVAGGVAGAAELGALVHCTRAVQTDLAVRDARESHADEGLRTRWREVAPGPEGWFLTADRPVFSPWRKLRLARAYAGTAVADMETAAAGAVAELSGVPWAALRAVSDGAGLAGVAQFRKNFPEQAGRAAATLPELLRRLRGPDA